MSYANGSGGTLTLPSPTHVHHVDVTSAVRSLRRSLSNSPSKFRLVSQKSPNSSPKSPLSPSLSPKRVTAQAASLFATTPIHTPSPLAKPFPPSVKLSLRSASRSKTAPPRAASKSRTSPRSPVKRALSLASDSGNSTSASQDLCVGKENRVGGSPSPTERVSFEKQRNMPPNVEITAPINHALSRLGDGAIDCGGGATATTSSPLKRSDAIMNLDQASLGSPVAKRRSLHGSASFGHDFNVFDHGPTSSPYFEIHDDSNQEYELSASSITASASLGPALTAMPRRSSSLRKSTLQQRHGDKSSWGRRHAAFELASSPADLAVVVATKSRPRLSLDQFIPPTSRESPFNTSGSLPNPSVHSINQANPPTHQPHPLSRTITTSSSGSSLVDDSPTHVPAHIVQQPRPRLDFSKSLPAGSLRPQPGDSGGGTFSTPDNYKSAKPLPAAFMSTGLISKVNRNPEKPQLPRAVTKGHIPDTPCKKPANGFATMPAAVPGSVVAKARHIRHSFGTPSTPFNPHGSQQGNGTFGQGVSVFGGLGIRGLTRRGSFLSVDGDEGLSSPDAKVDGQSGVDYDLPPTPTKQGLVPITMAQSGRKANVSPSGVRHVPAPISAIGNGHSQKGSRTSTSPLERIDFIERLSPCTPQDPVLPPDPSGLSISNHNGQLQKQGPTAATAMPLPATPTTGRDYFTPLGEQQLSVTPINGFAPIEIDETLIARFDKVELIGSGEFSQVYRVTQPAQALQSFFFGTSVSPPRGRSPPAPMPDRVFAVKKSRQPYQGTRDRQRKLQEVRVLKALGHSDHVVSLIDSWEANEHLYIQTEYCEEGSLDLFLSQVGRKGRLDDFRIWKIMLELCQGLGHIHDSGYIHLDLKPANIFITFEGVLKIGDFGMATAWPAKPGIEGEGDREYIGPEILLGQYDKPADVFALGLIMLEIAGNVQLPDNGPTWQRLRSGDMSDVPSLTWSSASAMARDVTGIPIDSDEPHVEPFGSDDDIETGFETPTLAGRKRHSIPPLSHNAGNLFGFVRRGELHHAPAFMRDEFHEHALDGIVRWMISPKPEDRPTVHQVLNSKGILWVQVRRRAGATVFEGNWGPADHVLADDTEMIDA